MSSLAKRVLLIHPFGIGDALFMTPVIESLYRSGIEKIDLVLGSRTKIIFENNPSINEIFIVDRDKIRAQSVFQNFLEIAKLVLKLRKNRYDFLFDFSLSRQYAFFCFLFLGIPKRFGFHYKNRGIFLTHKIVLEKSFSEKHIVEYYLELLKFVSIKPVTRSLQLFLSKEDEAKASEALRSAGIHDHEPFLVAAPGGGESWGKDARLKRWPVAYFAKLLELIRTNHCFGEFNLTRALILGGKNEWELGESLKVFDPDHFVNFCGKLPLRASAVILKRAKLLIANDGGLVHMAAALDIPAIALFGPVDPKVYGPYPLHPARVAITNEGPECRPCYQNMRYNSACQHIECLTTLYPKGIFNRLLDSGFFDRVRKISPHLSSVRPFPQMEREG